MPLPLLPEDERYMQAALDFAERNIGQTAPNPCVGALVVKNSVIIGQGVTHHGGRPHAEPMALAEAGRAASGATLYVTLEPCSHYGRSPPCTNAIVQAGIRRVVAALGDPDARVAGTGFSLLRQAGIKVVVGPGAMRAARQHRGHILRVTEKRPMVSVKIAQTRDGMAASAPEQPRLMITGQQMQAHVHLWRAQHDAILTGIGTILADDPLLNVRRVETHRQPRRIVLDRHLRLPPEAALLRDAKETEVEILCAASACPHKAVILRAKGAKVSAVLDESVPHLLPVLHYLYEQGVTRIFCESGPTLANAMILQGFADQLYVLTGAQTAPLGARPAFTPTAGQEISRHYTLIDQGVAAQDHWQFFERSIHVYRTD